MLSLRNCFRKQRSVDVPSIGTLDSCEDFKRHESMNRARYFFKKYIATGNEDYLEQMWSSLTWNGQSNSTKEETFEWARKQLSKMGPGTEYSKVYEQVEFLRKKKKELESTKKHLELDIEDLKDQMDELYNKL